MQHKFPALFGMKDLLRSIYLGYEQRFAMLQPPSERKSPWCSSCKKYIHQLPALAISAPRIHVRRCLHHSPEALRPCIVWISFVSLSIHGAVRKETVKYSVNAEVTHYADDTFIYFNNGNQNAARLLLNLVSSHINITCYIMMSVT